jgi:hypothetical protein
VSKHLPRGVTRLHKRGQAEGGGGALDRLGATKGWAGYLGCAVAMRSMSPPTLPQATVLAYGIGRGQRIPQMSDFSKVFDEHDKSRSPLGL